MVRNKHNTPRHREVFFLAYGSREFKGSLCLQDIISYDFSKIMAKEATIKSVFRYRNIYPQAIQAISQGIIPVKKIVTHEFDFSQTSEAFDFVIDHKDEVVKAVIKVS